MVVKTTDEVKRSESEKSTNRPTSAADFFARESSLTYLIEDVLVTGQPAVIAGPEKTCKTLVSLDMAYSLVTGTPFLGRFRVPKPVRVYLVSMECGEHDIKTKARAVAEARAVCPAQDGLFFDTDWFPRVPDDVPALIDRIRHARAEVVILDPLYLLLGDAGGNGTSLYGMGEVLRQFSRVATATKATVVLNHHFNRAIKPGQAPGLANLNGSGVGQWVRQWVLLNRRAEYADNGVHELVSRIGGSAGHAGAFDLSISEFAPCGKRVWSVAVTDTNTRSSPDVSKMPAAKLKVLDALRSFKSQEATMAMVRKKANVSGTIARRNLEALVADGLAVRHEADETVSYSYRGEGVDNVDSPPDNPAVQGAG